MKIKQFIPLILFIVYCTHPVVAQTQKEHKKGSYVDSLNRYYQHVDLPVYLYISTSPNDANPTPLKEISNKDKEVKAIYLDGPGVHQIKHMDAIHKKNDVFNVYGDNKAPVSTLNISTVPMYKSRDNLFYGKNLSISLTAKDDMSGVKQSYISINGSEYTNYVDKIKFDKEGDYTVKYYTVDNVGNVEEPKTFQFTVDLTAPKTFHNVIGIASGQVISGSSRIYLDKEDNKSGIESTYYYFDNEQSKILTGKEIQFKHLDNGEHTLYYWSTDKVKNQEEKQSFSFYLDKIAPIASMDILGDKFIVNDKIYFSGRTKVKLTAVDNRSGVKELKYSLNNSPFQNYVEPFYMPTKAGLYTISFFAVDDTDNRSEGEGIHSRGIVYVDLSGPILSYKLDGPIFIKGNNTYVGAKTKFNIVGKDLESGLKSLAYSINNNEETAYSEPFKIGSSNGNYKITYIGYDNVNNRNQNDVELVLDVDGPIIDVRFSTEPDISTTGEKIYPSYVQIYLSATDAKTTSSSILYTINDGKETTYSTSLKGFEPNKKYNVKIKAKDVLDNESTTEINFQIGNY